MRVDTIHFKTGGLGREVGERGRERERERERERLFHSVPYPPLKLFSARHVPYSPQQCKPFFILMPIVGRPGQIAVFAPVSDGAKIHDARHEQTDSTESQVKDPLPHVLYFSLRSAPPRLVAAPPCVRRPKDAVRAVDICYGGTTRAGSAAIVLPLAAAGHRVRAVPAAGRRRPLFYRFTAASAGPVVGAKVARAWEPLCARRRG